MGHKSKRGSIGVTIYGGQIRLRWRFNGKRFSLNAGPDTTKQHITARKIIFLIERDIAYDEFDLTLDKYRLKPKAPSKPTMTFVESFEHWVRNYRQMDCEVNIDYNSLRNTLRKWGRVDASNILGKLNNEKYNPSTYNRKLGLLKLFTKWLVKQKIWSVDPLEDVMKRKALKTVKSKRKPFTPQEITSILEAIRNNTFSRKGNRYPHSHYYPFIFFLFKTGVRPAEAVGLRVSSVDFEEKLIIIKEVMARALSSTNSKARIRKGTKNNKIRKLPLTDDLKEVLQPVVIEKDPDDLVFQSFSGDAVDDRMFLRRVFRPVLKALGIENRDLYCCRHTFGSRCIDSGIDPVLTSFLMGNNPETALRNYTHQLRIPKDLPPI
jgi:integrase